MLTLDAITGAMLLDDAHIFYEALVNASCIGQLREKSLQNVLDPHQKNGKRL